MSRPASSSSWARWARSRSSRRSPSSAARAAWNQRNPRAFLQLFTLAWAAYFFVKAVFYVWIVWTLPMIEAMALGSVVGSISLGVMIAISATQGRRLFFLCRRLGLLPKPEAPNAST
jgi:hypothetical protein